MASVRIFYLEYGLMAIINVTTGTIHVMFLLNNSMASVRIFYLEYGSMAIINVTTGTIHVLLVQRYMTIHCA
jgi:heptaprenylglyceryl phosphate synthase